MRNISSDLGSDCRDLHRLNADRQLEFEVRLFRQANSDPDPQSNVLAPDPKSRLITAPTV